MKTKSLIAALLLAASSAFAQVPSYVPTNGLVGWWPFNGNANDESGNGNNGTVNGAALTSDRFGTQNSCYNFRGGSFGDFISTNLIPAIGNSQRTICFWAMPTDSSGGFALMSYGTQNSGQTFSIGLRCSVGVNNFHSSINNAGKYYEQASIRDNWNFYSVVVPIGATTQNDILMYMNGILLTTGFTFLTPSTAINTGNQSPLVFGKLFYSPYFFKGKLDDVSIWNRELSAQEINIIYNAQACAGTGAITADGPTTFCAGNYVNLTSDVVGGTYQWKKNGVNVTSNGTSRTYKATATGSYTCVATCNGTALTSNAIQVTTKTNAFASVTASGATSFCAGDSVTLNCTNLGSNYSVQWYRTNISMENATNYSMVVKQPGTYKVVTKNLTTGCSRISGSAITTNVNCRIANNNQSEPTSNDINEESRTLAPELSQGVNLFPNPNNGSFKVTYEGEVEGEGTIQVINAMGQTIYQSQVTAEDNRINKEIFLGDHYQKGIYIVRLLINGGQNDSRMIVQ